MIGLLDGNNEVGGQAHITLRDIGTLTTTRFLLPIADRLESGAYLLYDGACGNRRYATGGREDRLISSIRLTARPQPLSALGTQSCNPKGAALHWVGTSPPTPAAHW